MKITMSLIFTKLFMENSNLSVKSASFDSERSVLGVRLLPVEQIHFNYDILYVCDEMHPIQKDGIPKDLMILCVGKKQKSLVHDGIHVFLRSDVEIALMLSDLQEIYIGFKEWHSSLERMVIKNKTVQTMVEASEAIINAPMLMYDPSLKIIGVTKHIDIKDQIFTTVTSHGFLPHEYIKFFQDERVFHHLNFDGEVESAPKAYRQHRDYITVLKNNNNVLGHAVILLPEDQNKDYQIYLFKLLCQLIVENLSFHSAQKAAYDYLLTDIIDGVLSDSDSIVDRVKYINLPLHGNYTLLMLSPIDENSVPDRVIVNAFSTMLPSAKVFSYNNRILILEKLKDLTKNKYMSQIQNVISQMNDAIHSYGLRCSISKSFSSILDLKTAFVQCDAAFTLDSDLKNTFITYENVWLQHMFSICDNAFPLENFCEPVIQQIASMKQTGAVTPLEILKVYLETDRQLSVAAKELHMHRNNVLYHINRLRSQYNLELDDSEQRLHLLISLKIWEYIQKKGRQTDEN